MILGAETAAGAMYTPPSRAAWWVVRFVGGRRDTSPD